MTLTPEDRVATLSPRELDVARLAARGFSARYIARRYGISHRTVETHTRHIHEKLLISTRDALIENYADLLLARGGDIPTPHFAARPAPSIPVGVALAPAAPIEPSVMHVAGPVGVLCGAMNPTHITDGTRYADCPACLETAERLVTLCHRARS